MKGCETQHKSIHHGNNVRRLRLLLGVKQDSIADDLNITQPSFSKLETRAVIDDETLKKIASYLKVPVDTIKNMNDEGVYNYITNFNDKVENIGTGAYFVSNQYQPTFNPIDKIIELYERMLADKEDKVRFIEEFLKKNNSQ